jgi:hypothetical protein
VTHDRGKACGGDPGHPAVPRPGRRRHGTARTSRRTAPGGRRSRTGLRSFGLAISPEMLPLGRPDHRHGWQPGCERRRSRARRDQPHHRRLARSGHADRGQAPVRHAPPPRRGPPGHRKHSRACVPQAVPRPSRRPGTPGRRSYATCQAGARTTTPSPMTRDPARERPPNPELPPHTAAQSPAQRRHRNSHGRSRLGRSMPCDS